jgi:fructokinase
VTTAAGSILVVGESLVDVVTRPDGQVSEHPGGSPANVALTLARLGRPTYLFTHVGDDDYGRLVLDHLEASGVRLVEGSVLPGATSVARATLDASGGATYEFELEWALPDVELPAAPAAVHTGSIAAVLQPGAATVERILVGARRASTTSYDPNLRPALMGSPEEVRPQVEGLVAASDVVKLSDEDARWLAPDTDPEDLLAQWLTLGPALVVLTRGGDGALAVGPQARVDVRGRRVDVADTVGAGDSFSGALIDALAERDLLGADRRDALRALDEDALADIVGHAVRVSAITVSRPGADPPTRDELADLA